MKEYVERDFVLKHVAECQKEYPCNGTEREKGVYDTCAHFGAFVELVPPSDVAPVVHGWWDIDKSFMPFVSTCSECGGIYDIDGAFEWKFCPNCGAKMDLMQQAMHANDNNEG